MQKAFVLYYLTDKRNNLNELNELLNNGWRVVSQNAMGGGEANNAVYSLVVLETST